jgi:hypothetical protein
MQCQASAKMKRHRAFEILLLAKLAGSSWPEVLRQQIFQFVATCLHGNTSSLA